MHESNLFMLSNCILALYIYHYVPVNVLAPHIFPAQIIVYRPCHGSDYYRLLFTGHGFTLSNFIGLFGPLPFRNPHGITVNDTGTVYVCDTGNDHVQRFEA